MKTCTKCSKTKAVEEFYRQKRVKNGFQPRCKACCRKYSRQHYKINIKRRRADNHRWKKENPERHAELARLYNKRHRFRVALLSSRKFAEKCGHAPCDATEEEIETAFTGFCHTCGRAEKDNNKRLCIDHSHNIEINNFRGWLCSNCNRFAGRLEKNRTLVSSLLKYLDSHEPTT